MNRLLRIIAVAVAVVLAAALLTWRLAFRTGTGIPGNVVVDGLSSTAAVHWKAGGDAVVEAPDDRDFDSVLGVVHGLGKPWTLLLYRQAALGRLSEWYGRETLAADHLVHRLGIPTISRTAFDALPEPQRARLIAYAAGVNAVLSEPRVRLAPAVSAMDLEIEPWQAWHALAVERLIAWLGTEVVDRSMEGDPDVADFHAARADLERLLGAGALDHAAAWHMTSQPPGLFVRWVTGSSGIPPVTVVSLQTATGRADYATWVGMPHRWAGRNAVRTWAALPSGSAVVEPGSLSVAARYERLRLRDGSRDVVVRRRTGNRAAIGDAHVLVWNGLEPVSDVGAVAALASGSPVDFRLTNGLALAMRADTPDRIVTTGRTVYDAGGVTLVSSAPEAPDLAAALESVSSVGVEGVFDDVQSAWAGVEALALKSRLLPDSAYASDIRPVLPYLSNWEGDFDGASIGATLHDVLQYAAEPESESTLRALVDTMQRRFGPDLRTWRWERTDARLTYPGYVPPSEYPSAPGLPSRYAPLGYDRRGHPTAPGWGTAGPWVERPAPAAWEAYLGVGPDGTLTYRRPYVPFDRLLGRYSSAQEGFVSRSVRQRESTGDVTRLLPRTP